MAIILPQLGAHLHFPRPEQALDDPNGLLAYGGDLSNARLLRAYQSGIFPWYSEGEPLLWWSPDPRGVLFPDAFHLSKSLRKFLKRTPLRVTLNHDFEGVISACATIPRQGLQQEETENHNATWITHEMQQAYKNLAKSGAAHSIEVWQESQLIGGLYGVNVGQVFCGESMFHKETNASKLALFCLVSLLQPYQHSFIDCQMQTAHLASLGAKMVPRSVFLKDLARAQQQALPDHFWQPRHLFEQQQWLG